jgi:hypothetical protein
MAKVKLVIDGKDKASAKIKGVTGSMIKAQLAVELLKVATKALVNVTNDAIEAFGIQEKAESKLRAATQTNIDGFKKYASELQSMTIFGDEAILNAQQLASSMGVSNDQLNQAAKDAVSLSSALGTDLSASMKLTANAMQGNFDVLSRYIPELKQAETDAEKQAIVQEKMAQGFKIATAEANTFSGKLEQLKNAQGDNLEVMGGIISVIGSDFVDSLIDAQTGLVDFLKTAEGMETVAKIATIVKGAFNLIVDNIKGAIDVVFDFVSAIIESGKVIGTFFDFVKSRNKETWDAVKEQTAKAGESFKELADSGTGLAKGLFDSIKSEIDNFDENVLKLTDKIEKANNLGDIKQKGVEIGESLSEGINEGTEKGLEKQPPTFKEWSGQVTSIVQNTLSTIKDIMSVANEEALVALQENLTSQLEAIDEHTQGLLEIQGVAEETRSEIAAGKIASLQAEIAAEQNAENKKRLQTELKEAQSEAKRIKILDDGEKKKESVRKKAAEKEKAEKIKQFQQNKAMAIANVWINAATAVMGFWAAFASMGIPGLVLAGVATAAALVLAGVQTGLIASQNPSFEEGGVIPGQSFTGDRVQINANSGERVLTAEQNRGFEEIVFGNGGGGNGGIVINGNVIVQANNIEEFNESLNENRRFQLGRS